MREFTGGLPGATSPAMGGWAHVQLRDSSKMRGSHGGQSPIAAPNAVGSDASTPTTFACKWERCLSTFGSYELLRQHLEDMHLYKTEPASAHMGGYSSGDPQQDGASAFESHESSGYAHRCVHTSVTV